MTELNQDKIESTEESLEKQKNIIPEIAKYKNPPAFQHTGSFNKWKTGNIVNNRQRPGRAANRGR